MGKPKKNQLHQVLFPLVDKTDFAAIESGVTSNITAKYFGVNHGGSAAMTSGTVSKAISVVHSGIFRMTLKAAENNYDNMLLRITHASCADQILTWENADYDDSDIYSQLSDARSSLRSVVVAGAGLNASAISDVESALASRLSDILSAAQQGNSRTLVIESTLSDIQSQITAGAGLTASAVSDVESALASRLSDILSAAQQGNSRTLVIESTLSDIQSQITAGAGLTASAVSDVESALASRLSDILSAAQQANSRVLVVQSTASDLYSLLSDVQSDFQSRVPKETASKSLLSDVNSDLASKVGAIAAGGTVNIDYETTVINLEGN